MATEIGTLVARFQADTSNFDRGILGVEAKTLGVATVMKSLGSASVALQGPLGGVAGRLQGIGSLAAQAGTGLGAVGVAIAALSAVTIGLGVAIFKLAETSADAAGDLFDLSQKTGFAVETLSTLSNVAKTTGSDIGSLSASLGIFQKNMEAANDTTSTQGKLFKSLSLDTQNNEKALRQAFAALGKMSEGSHQTATAMALFGRSGKDVLAIIKETNGNLDLAQQKFAELGTLISGTVAKQADQFNDDLEKIKMQLSAMARTVGAETLPAFIALFGQTSAALEANKAEWKNWGHDIAMTILTVQVALAGVAGAIRGLFSGLAGGPLGAVAGGIAGITSSADKTTTAYKNIVSPPVGADVSIGGLLKPAGAGGGGARGGGRGGGGEDPAKTAQRIATLQLAAVVAGLQAEQDANKRSLDIRREDFNTYATKYMTIEDRRHNAVVAGLDAEQKAAERLKKGREVALLEIENKRTAENVTHETNRNEVLDQRGKILDDINRFIRDQERAIVGVTSQTSEWDRAYEALVDTLKDEGVTLEANTNKRIKANIELAKERDLILSVTRARQVLQSVRERIVTKAMKDRAPWEDLGGGSTVGGEPGTTTRPRIATVEQQVARERLAKIREQMTQLAGDLTNVFSQSISAGFNQGIKSGLQTLAQGLLQIVEQIFLKRLAEGLSQILGNIATGAGGSILGKIGGAILGGIGGSLGSGSVGGAGTGAAGALSGIHFAQGGIVPGTDRGYDSVQAVLQPGERVLTRSQQMNQPVVNNHYTINLPPAPRGGYVSPKSARQQADMILAALQGAST